MRKKKEGSRTNAGSGEMHDDADEDEEPGAACLEVSEPKCKSQCH